MLLKLRRPRTGLIGNRIARRCRGALSGLAHGSVITTSPQIIAKDSRHISTVGIMPSPVRSIVPLVVAALISGFLSYATEGLPRLSHSIEMQLTAYLINPKLLLPGVWFGLVTGALAWRFGSRGLMGAALAFALTWVGWQLAVQAGIATFHQAGVLTPVETSRIALAGFAGGAVGAIVTFLGVRLAVPMPRTMVALVATVVTGSVFGLLLPWSTTRQSAGLLLYAAWQPAVVAVMSYFAARKPAL